MKIKITLSFYLSHYRMIIIKKSNQMTNKAGEGVEKNNFSLLSTMEINMEIPQKTRNETICATAIPLLSV